MAVYKNEMDWDKFSLIGKRTYWYSVNFYICCVFQGKAWNQMPLSNETFSFEFNFLNSCYL